MRADLVRSVAGGVPQKVRQDFPHEVGFLRVGAPGLAVPAGGAVPHGERVPAAAGDQALEGLSRLSQGGLRAADPVSPGGRMRAGGGADALGSRERVFSGCTLRMQREHESLYPMQPRTLA